MKLILRMQQRYYTEERLVRYVGSYGRATVVKFKGSDLHFDEVQIVEGTSVPMNRTLQVQKAMGAMKAGAFANPDPEKAEKRRQELFQLIELNVTMETTLDAQNWSRARDENLRLLQGEDIRSPRISEHQQIHIDAIDLLLTSSEFYNLNDADQQKVESLAMQHKAIHVDMLRGIQQKTDISPETLGAIQMEKQGLPPQQVPMPQRAVMEPAVGQTGMQLPLIERPGTTKTGNQFGGSRLPNSGQGGA